ncbi:dUTP diphosphatase [Mycoplasma feriruminatoris]|uniref:dUTPase family protein n=1 Tax=Mycoplasma feriruminatoris TaxID=1179777 RepID=A0AAX3TG92_9MOLU|nr:dUTP diphosphatase [Mycoplasma feriruminatoris]UKS54107.1 dUTPase family protein [Mycoplasma feriruminatoris]WFQ91810.1 hypothetical protein MFERI14815_00422 [Mycoplasma feriruminatoris]WFQ92632.1 hypothetical protein MFERI14822_00420 [Mycoplasma feriruminatoris]WFQ94338.1 hypothetical protein MFERI15220_00415 [Mycoplasma feriruminatoris]WFQ95984.1 dUTP diphosphatase [Mycoplasma feriruminatoris]
MIDNKTLKWLSEKQIILDQFIQNKWNFKSDKPLLDKKLTAFLVELGEYANEERSFKYWSNKKPSDLEIQLDEYIDGIHFIISVGNQINYNFEQFNYSFLNKDSIIEVYFEIISCLNDFIKDNNNINYSNLLNAFLNICQIKNYTQEQIINAYNIKNEINFQRQNNNY